MYRNSDILPSGIDHDKVQIGVTAHGLRGAVATDDIADGEVPGSHARMMCTHKQKHSTFVRACFSFLPVSFDTHH